MPLLEQTSTTAANLPSVPVGATHEWQISHPKITADGCETCQLRHIFHQ
uniref:Uncharacterized protein n=1 Tax=Moniliophthora roreri TaxID=221103 RepID=A0A0W0G9T5_MONRR